MRHFLGTVLAITGMLVPAVADAGDIYVGLSGGVDLTEDMGFDGTGIDQDAGLSTGAGLAASIGYRFDSGFRTEAEISYRYNGVDDVSGTDASGDVHALSGMANLLYDFKTDTPITPYLGAGAGVAGIKADGISPVAGTRVDDSDIAAAVQGMAGLAYRVDQNWSVTADYQYFTAPDVNFSTDSGVDVDSRYTAHTFRVGLRFDFGGPAAKAEGEESPLLMSGNAPANGAIPAAAETAGEPPETPAPHRFVALFEWDSAKLTPDALSVVAEAAEQAKDGKAVRIEATGHADRSGPADYNLTLSKKRAKAVREELVRLGIEAGQIEMAWKGESNPAVPTPDGQREGRNRRVEIVIP